MTDIGLGRSPVPRDLGAFVSASPKHGSCRTLLPFHVVSACQLSVISRRPSYLYEVRGAILFSSFFLSFSKVLSFRPFIVDGEGEPQSRYVT